MKSFEPNIEQELQGYEAELNEWVTGRISSIRKLLARCESPAEHLLLLALIQTLDARPIADHFAAFPRWGPGLERFIVRLHPQHSVRIEHEYLLREPKDYRLDFLLTLERDEHEGSSESTGLVHAKVAVEVDGHDYHERTKEQAKRDRLRDRMLTQAGYFVMRYTGSEVYQDAHLQATEIEGLLSNEASRVYSNHGP